MKKTHFLNIILIIMLFTSWIWFALDDNKPKTSADLVNYLLVNDNDDLEDVIQRDSSLEGKDIKNRKEYFQNSTEITQFFIVEANHKESPLLIETTPSLINNKLLIKDIKEINMNTLQNILTE
ncbi:hypothetical protein [Aquisalibacillus elongatus]|uniref:Uncharacterized protein n=1 Tax=Aquisalibacillus elongatus TaxID=485577 RepID=A0A3N5B1H5_9BACI|nr:hypothetical protein [Aquisalibacillus elongatus]RPF51117.1 hypothetical protein EDC24_2384 [Aquisalibacillus elongatus]